MSWTGEEKGKLGLAVCRPWQDSSGLYLLTLFRYRFCFWKLVTYRGKVKYQGAALGVVWSLLNPLLTLVVLALVFSQILGLPGRPYVAFLLAGLIPWSFLSRTIVDTAASLSNHSELAKKTPLPLALFPLASLASNLVHLGFGLAVLLLLIPWLLGKSLGGAILFLPYPIACMGLSALGVGMALAGLHLRYRDIGYLLEVALLLLFYASPIIYPIERLGGWVATVLGANPASWLLECFRAPVVDGRLPAAWATAGSGLWGLGACVLGWKIFTKGETRLLENLNR